jgi:hypothetical protein
VTQLLRQKRVEVNELIARHDEPRAARQQVTVCNPSRISRSSESDIEQRSLNRVAGDPASSLPQHPEF